MTYTDTSQAALGAIDIAKKAALRAVTADLERATKRELQTLVYDTPESPNYRRTGNLINSVTHRVTSDNAQVNVGAQYAWHVHEGNQYVGPRPFLANAVKRQKRKLPKLVADAFAKAGLR